MKENSLIGIKRKSCGAAAFLCVAVISGCYTGPDVKTVAVPYEVNGCRFNNIELSVNGEITPSAEYSGWSGECKNGYLVGAGFLRYKKYPGSLFTVFTSGKPLEFYIGVDEAGMPGSYGQTVLGKTSKNHSMYNSFTDAECVLVKGCKIVRDAYLATATKEQKERLVYNSEVAKRQRICSAQH